MKADNIDHFEVVLSNPDYDDLMDWVDANYIECHRVSFDISLKDSPLHG